MDQMSSLGFEYPCCDLGSVVGFWGGCVCMCVCLSLLALIFSPVKWDPLGLPQRKDVGKLDGGKSEKVRDAFDKC